MKRIINLLAITVLVSLIFACNKVADLPVHADGSAPVLTASKTTVTPALADSNKSVLTLTWTSPKYATSDSTVKYLLEIDSVGGNFLKPYSKEVTGKLSGSYTARDLNGILLSLGYAPGAAANVNVRLVSSYANNNERHVSNMIRIAITPFNDPSKLTSSATSVVGSAATETQKALTFNWSQSFIGYTGNITYTMEYDSAGKNFASAQMYDLSGATSTKDITIGEINDIALKENVVPTTVGKIEFRVKAVTASGAVAYSNAVSVSITTYSPAPANLYIVGGATPGGWANPVPTPSQQFTKINANTFTITIGLTAGDSYLFLPVNGSWTNKYGGATDGTAPGGGTLLKDNAVPGSNTPSPSTSGVYKIEVNFQTGKYTVTQIVVPSNLYIVGDATPGGWGNPVPTPSQQFTRIDNVSYGLVVNLTAGKSYLFLPVNGSWTNKFGGATDGTSVGGGTLLADNAVPGSNTPPPATSGLYRIVVNFATNTYTVTPYTGPSSLYIVGDATPGGWGNPVPTPSQEFTQTAPGVFQLSLPLSSSGSYLLLPVNGSWDHKYGGGTDGTSTFGGTLLADGAVPGSNTPPPATSGTYTITVNFGSMTYKVQ